MIWLRAFALTLAIEAPIVLVGLAKLPRARVAWVFFGINCLTHGLLWTLWPRLSGTYFSRVLVAELAVVVVEALAYWLLAGASARRAFVVSLAANAASTVLGLYVL